MIVIGALSPHPPLLVLDPDATVLSQVQDTFDSLVDLAKRMAAAQPQRLVIISPHAPVHPTAFPIYLIPHLRGDMSRFHHPEVELDYPIDIEFSRRLAAKCNDRGLETFFLDERNAQRFDIDLSMDHGTFVPLHFLHKAGLNVPLVVLGTSGLSPQQHGQLGTVLGELLAEDPVPTALIASGDLSHRLLASGAYGFDAQGPVFDEAITKAVRENDIKEAAAIPAEVVTRAGQCGYRPIMTLLAAMPGAQTSQLSYEGPFGVGYCVAYLTPESASRTSTEAVDELPDSLDIRLDIARQAVETFVRQRRVLELPEAEGELANPAPTFVTLKIAGQLRGCIGTLMATCPSQQQEIIQNAISACSRDPRFDPVSECELPHLQYQVYVLGEMEPIASTLELDPHRYGVVVCKGNRRGVLLPNLEGIDTVEQQVQIACRKGGIDPKDNPELLRFEVKTYGA